MTLPLGALFFGVLWYLPFEQERQQAGKKSIIELWSPWVRQTIDEMRKGGESS